MRAAFSIVVVTFLTSALGSTGCGSSQGLKPGATAAQVRSVKGEPLRSVTTPVRKAEVMEYADGTAYQVEGDSRRVVAAYRRPDPHERAVQYWKHRWATGRTELRQIRSYRGVEGERTFQLLSPDGKTYVIYDQRTGIVREVVEYGR